MVRCKLAEGPFPAKRSHGFSIGWFVICLRVSNTAKSTIDISPSKHYNMLPVRNGIFNQTIHQSHREGNSLHSFRLRGHLQK